MIELVEFEVTSRLRMAKLILVCPSATGNQITLVHLVAKPASLQRTGLHSVFLKVQFEVIHPE